MESSQKKELIFQHFSLWKAFLYLKPTACLLLTSLWPYLAFLCQRDLASLLCVNNALKLLMFPNRFTSNEVQEDNRPPALANAPSSSRLDLHYLLSAQESAREVRAP